MGVEYRSAAYVEIAKLHARKSRWQSVLEYAEKATDFNRTDVTAAALKILAHRSMGNSSQAKLHLDALGASQPLNPFFKWENLLASSPKTLESFPLKNELPEESLLELAQFYADLGLTQEATKILLLLPKHPLALYTLAYLTRADQSTSRAWLNMADALPTLMVFPFRTEDIPVLEWAIQNTGHWKPHYYLGLLLHDKNKHDEALKLLQNLGDKPDAAHFYALRALWTKNDPVKKEADLGRAIALDQSWRYPKLLTQHFIQQNEYSKALSVISKYKKDHPGKNFIMDMLLAKSLLLNKQYKSSDSLLALMDIIPFEGATDGRALYWEAKMMQAIQAIKANKYKLALNFINQASEWPENLGVGKPYDNDIDARLEQYLSYICLQKLNQKTASAANLDKILAFKPGIHNTIMNFQPANHLVTKWASEARGNSLDWNAWMKQQMDQFPQFIDTFKWVLATGNGEAGLNGKTSSQDPWMRVIQEFSSK
jgi:hypothetical protein